MVRLRLLGQDRLHGLAIELAVGLGARPAHRRALAAIEDAELDAGAVGGAAHHPVERVDLPDQMPLGQAADRRIARHFADGFDFMGEQQGAGAQARGRRRRLAAGVPAADNHHVESIHGANLAGQGREIERYRTEPNVSRETIKNDTNYY